MMGSTVNEGLFDVSHPLVLLGEDQPPPLWERHAPSPLMVVALVAPGTRVAEVGAGDGALAVLSALLGAHVSVTGNFDQVRRNAAVNGVHVDAALDVTHAMPLDLVITHGPDHLVPEAIHDIPVVLSTGALHLPDRVPVTVSNGQVQVGHTPVDGQPLLLVDPHREAAVCEALDAAVVAFSRRAPNRWAEQANASALRLAEQHRADSYVEVRRAYDQMQSARDELRAVRASRSWRYTGVLRNWSQR